MRDEVRKLMLYHVCESTRDRIKYLLKKAISVLTKPIYKTLCRMRGHGKIWVIDGWPFLDTRYLICSRCGEWSVVVKDDSLTPCFRIYDPRTGAFRAVGPLPKSPFEEVAEK